jgi:hypothetical protein
MKCRVYYIYCTPQITGCDTWVFVTLKIELKSYNRPTRLSCSFGSNET